MRMRFFALALVAAIVAACSSGSSNGASGVLVCAPDGSCPPGLVCVYSTKQGCDAPAVCIASVDAGLCQGALLCTCAGGFTSDCATPGYAPQPVAAPGECPSSGSDGGTE
jgi:hypothetical protein